MVNAFNRIQRKGGQIITGAFKTTAGAAVEIEAHLLPVTLQIKQTALETAIRIRTSPLYQEMIPIEGNHRNKGPLDLLYNTLQTRYNINPDSLENRRQFTVPP